MPALDDGTGLLVFVSVVAGRGLAFVVARSDGDSPAALRLVNWLCDQGWMDDHRDDDAWLAETAKYVQDAAERWPEMSKAARKLAGPYFRRGDLRIRAEVLWAESGTRPIPELLLDLIREPGGPPLFEA